MRSSTGSPVFNATSACTCTLASAHSPPTNPTIVPSVSTSAVAPAFADVGFSARTTVAATYGSRRAASSRARARKLRRRVDQAHNL